MITLWGRLSSINVRKVEWALRELDVKFERIDTGGSFGGTQTPEFVARNPNRMIPVIDDGGTVLWESNVIVRYLAARHAPDTLYPQALPARFVAEQWMDWQQTTLNPAGRPAFMQLVRTPEDRRNPALIEQSRAETDPLLDLLDAHLAQRPYIAGERFTMADIPIGCEIHRWFALPLPRPSRPHLQRWWASVIARPAAAAVLTLPLT